MEKMWWRLARIYARRGHEVTIVSRTWDAWPKDEIVESVRILRVPGFDHRSPLWQNLLLDARWGSRVARALPGADILITNTVALPVFVRALRPDAGLLVVNLNRFPKGQARWYRKVSRIQAASTAIADELRTQAPAVAPLVKVVPNPIDLASFAAEKSARRSEHVEIGYFGRIHPEKGLATLLRAVEGMARNTQLGPWRLTLRGHTSVPHGGGGDDFVRHLKSIAPELWTTGKIVLAASLTDPAALARAYENLDVFCYPTEAESGEANPVAVSEAMAAGLPVVATELDCFRDQLNPLENALLVPVGDPKALQLALARLVAEPALRARLGAAGRARARALDDQLIASQHLDDYQSLLDAAQR